MNPYLANLVAILERYPGKDLMVIARNRSTIEFLKSFPSEKEIMDYLYRVVSGLDRRPFNPHEWRALEMISETNQEINPDFCDDLRNRHNKLIQDQQKED